MTKTILVLGTPPPAEKRMIDELAPRCRLVYSDSAAGFGPALKEASALFHWDGSIGEIQAAVRGATKLEWFQFRFAGIDAFVCDELRSAKFVVTNGRGVYAPALAEFTIAAILHFSRGFPRLARDKAAREWDERETPLLRGKALGIVGYGEIGRAVAALAKPFGMRIHGLRRRPEQSRGDPFADRVVGLAELRDLVSESDFLVVSAALTDASRALIGKAEIAAMKPGAVLVNVGRGETVDEGALADALGQKRIHGAALDVFVHEPLPASSPFWALDNVIISPHCADRYPGWLEPPARLFMENAKRFLDGKQLVNIVDMRAGY